MKLKVLLAFSLVLALIIAGCGSSNEDPVSPSNPPSTPSGLTTSVIHYNAAHLGWNAVTGADSILIERAAGLSQTTGFSTVGAVVGTATSYHSAGLTAATQYTYRVRAKNTYGTTVSTTLNVTTKSLMTWQAQASDNAYDGMLYIANATTDTDSIYYIKIIPNQTGTLANLRIMFGNFTGYTKPANGAIVEFRSAIGTPMGTPIALTAAQMVENSSTTYNWTTVVVLSSTNPVAVTNGTPFYVLVRPNFGTGSSERFFLSGKDLSPSNRPATDPVTSFVWRRTIDPTGQLRYTDWDHAISAQIEY